MAMMSGFISANYALHPKTHPGSYDRRVMRRRKVFVLVGIPLLLVASAAAGYDYARGAAFVIRAADSRAALCKRSCSSACRRSEISASSLLAYFLESLYKRAFA